MLNKNRDREFDFHEYYDSKLITNIKLIKLNEKEPLFVGHGWFIIFTILSLIFNSKIPLTSLQNL